MVSRHAKEKFQVLARRRLYISEGAVKEVITESDSVGMGDKGRFIAQKAINERHALRVIYEKKENEIVVVTFYPARRRRCEN